MVMMMMTLPMMNTNKSFALKYTYKCIGLICFFFLKSADTKMHMETIRMTTYTRGRRLSTMSHIQQDVIAAV